MSPEQMAEMQDRYMQGMRALSKEEMEQRMLEEARGMMNVYPQAFYGNATQAAMNNAAPRVATSLPLSVARPESAQHPAEAISGPHGHRLTLWGRIVWRWRVMRAERMRPRGVQ